jgi:hypothetical protein
MLLLLLVILLRTVEAHLQTQSPKLIKNGVEHHLQSQSLKCITSICERYFEEGTTVVISVPCDRYFPFTVLPQDTLPSEQISRHDLQSQNIATYGATFLIQQLHGMLKWPIVVSQGSAGQCHDHKRYNYILWTSVMVSKQLEDLKSLDKVRNPRGNFLVVLNKIHTNFRQQVYVILKELWNRKILNAIVLLPASREQHILDIYSWFPYESPSGKCGQIRAVVHMDQCVMHKGGVLARNVSLFPMKIPRDLGRCPLTVSTFPFPPFTIRGHTEDVTYTGGFEIRLLEFVAEAMNMSIVYRPPPLEKWGQKLENGSWTGIEGDLTLGRADIGLAGMILSQDEAVDMDFTVSHGSLGFMWVVPCARPFPRWKSITRVFSLAAWLLIFMTIILGAIILMCLARNKEHELALYKTLTGCVFYSWAVVLGVSAESAPISGAVRLFFLLWIWYSLAINTVFQTFVTSYLVNPGLKKQMKSISDILESGVQYGFHPDLKVNLIDESDELLTEIVAHSEPCNVVDDCTLRIAERGDFVTIGNHHRIEYLNTYRTLDGNGNVRLCTFGDNVILNFKTFYIPKGSPLLYSFNHAISVAVQAGLVDYWWKSELVTSRIKAASVRRISLLDDYSAFLLTYLQSAFYLLFFGYSCALLVFVGELLCHHIFTDSKVQRNQTSSSSR